jgi:methyl-galactoside transport system substrate-binding protein
MLILVFAIAALALAAFLARGFLDSERAQSVEQSFKIGVFSYKGEDTFISSLTNSLREIVSAFEREQGENLYLSIQEAAGSQALQNIQIERSISLGYNVLVVNLVDRTSAAYVIDKAMEADVPVIFFNREPVQADMRKWDKLFYVGTDASMNGILEGRIAADAYLKDPKSFDFNGDGILQYIMMEGEFRHQDSILRTESSVQAIQDAGIAVEKLDGGIANWERSQGAALAKEYFGKYGKQIELILCNNDDMALGVIDYIDAEGLDFANIVGIDGTPQGLDAVSKGKMLGTVIIDYYTQAQYIFDLIHLQITGQAPVDFESRYIRAPLRVVTKDEKTANP